MTELRGQCNPPTTKRQGTFSLVQTPTTFVAVSCSLVALITIIFAVPTWLFFRRRHFQPIKAKTPMLILVSTVGNWLFVAISLLNMIIHFDPITSDKFPEVMSRINRLEVLVCHPMFFIPYILR